MKLLGAAAFLVVATAAYANDVAMIPPTAEPKASVPMPAEIVLIICKVKFVPATDEVEISNQKFTSHRKTEWDTPDAMMHCRRKEVQLWDAAEGAQLNPQDDPAPAMTFNRDACNATAMRQAAQFDIENADRPWRVWRTACPVPTMDLYTKRIIQWMLPPCGHRDTVICDVDSEI